MRKIKALVLGCGKIGAGYDFDNTSITQTHARAFFNNKNVELFVADENHDKAIRAAQRFNASIFELVENTDYSSIDIISLATPTSDHFQYLYTFLNQNIPVVVCEKPITNSLESLGEITTAYKKSTSKILVNYIRRFQPAFISLQKYIEKVDQADLLELSIRYHRGLLNNGTHGIDLIEFLFRTSFHFKNFRVGKMTVDAFPEDPTVSGEGIFLNCPIHFITTPDTGESIFEIEIKTKKETISILERGDTIIVKQNDTDEISIIQKNILTHYMQPVINIAIAMLNQQEADNFEEALALNKKTLEFIKKVK